MSEGFVCRKNRFVLEPALGDKGNYPYPCHGSLFMESYLCDENKDFHCMNGYQMNDGSFKRVQLSTENLSVLFLFCISLCKIKKALKGFQCLIGHV